VDPIEARTEAERVFTLSELLPIFQKYGEQYGFDYRITAGVAYQESGFRNYRVHNDGTGHGLGGFDDNGLLPDYERWSGTRVGRGSSAVIMPVGKQIEYMSYMLARYAVANGDPYVGTQAWHRGPTLWNDAAGRNYNALIRQHVRTLFG